MGRCLDYVSIVYDNSTIGPLCGKLKGDDLKTMHFVTKANSIKIEFVSDSKISSQGFRAVYQSSHVRGKRHNLLAKQILLSCELLYFVLKINSQVMCALNKVRKTFQNKCVFGSVSVWSRD